MNADQIQLRNSGPQLTADELLAFEEEIGGCLPDDYKRFLLRSNGGMTEPSLGYWWNGEMQEVSGFRILYPTSESGLRRALQNLRELRIDGYFPVADSSIDGDVCLAFQENGGSIWMGLYSRDNDVAVEAFMMPLANSFTEFLDSLFPIPNVYCPIEELGETGTPETLAQHLAQGNSIDAMGKYGETILLRAISFQNASLVRACIKHGADLTGTLHRATSNGRLDFIKMLVDAGADINERDEYGDRPLRHVGGTALPGDEGTLHREVRDLLITLGAIE